MRLYIISLRMSFGFFGAPYAWSERIETLLAKKCLQKLVKMLSVNLNI